MKKVKAGMKKLLIFFKKYFVITVFSFVYAAGISLFLDPNNLAPGGVTGVSILLNRVTNIETGTWMLLINIPILILGLWKFGIRFTISTIYCTIISSVFTNLLTPFGAVTNDPLLAACAGSVLVAVAIGIIFKFGATTGGVDVVMRVIKCYKPHLKTGTLYFCGDLTVVAASAFVFGNIETALYAAIAVFVCSNVLDLVLYGRDGAKMVYIISDKSEEIAKRLFDEVDVGATFLHGKGAFTGNDKTVLFCAIKKPDYPKLEQIVREIDHDSFTIVSDASEIFGENYKSYFSERL